ncbi:hypothetical protein OPT61_g8601 [Boeremia exigua]|uniref:Uncharacterized protein n=1 Tax=Boeremia exigua TaxID=749465 RepID=A0ACC2HY01_9PLEO|nr:hypothetical protein OPT61_g8601 [Boeremia exigua]
MPEHQATRRRKTEMVAWCACNACTPSTEVGGTRSDHKDRLPKAASSTEENVFRSINFDTQPARAFPGAFENLATAPVRAPAESLKRKTHVHGVVGESARDGALLQDLLPSFACQPKRTWQQIVEQQFDRIYKPPGMEHVTASQASALLHGDYRLLFGPTKLLRNIMPGRLSGRGKVLRLSDASPSYDDELATRPVPENYWNGRLMSWADQPRRTSVRGAPTAVRLDSDRQLRKQLCSADGKADGIATNNALGAGW